MSNHRCTGAMPAAGLSRRAVLNRFGLGLGGIALSDLCHPVGASAAPPPPLDGQAKLAVERFQAISIDLATLTDPPLSGRPCAPRSNPSIGTSTGTSTGTGTATA